LLFLPLSLRFFSAARLSHTHAHTSTERCELSHSSHSPSHAPRCFLLVPRSARAHRCSRCRRAGHAARSDVSCVAVAASASVPLFFWSSLHHRSSTLIVLSRKTRYSLDSSVSNRPPSSADRIRSSRRPFGSPRLCCTFFSFFSLISASFGLKMRDSTSR